MAFGARLPRDARAPLPPPLGDVGGETGWAAAAPLPLPRRLCIVARLLGPTPGAERRELQAAPRPCALRTRHFRIRWQAMRLPARAHSCDGTVGLVRPPTAIVRPRAPVRVCVRGGCVRAWGLHCLGVRSGARDALTARSHRSAGWQSQWGRVCSTKGARREREAMRGVSARDGTPGGSCTRVRAIAA
eukprot:937694-Prymnesium_polylepis.2